MLENNGQVENSGNKSNDVDLNSLDLHDGESNEVDTDLLDKLGLGKDLEKPVSNREKPSNKKEEFKSKSNNDQKSEDTLNEILKELKGDKETTEDETELEESSDDEQSEEDSEEETDLIELKVRGKSEKLPLEKVKEYAQKGLDYTAKTQELSKQKMAFESRVQELEAKEQQFQEREAQLYSQFEQKQKILDQWDLVIDHLKDNDQDTYELLQNVARNTAKQYNNPMINKLQSKINELESKTNNSELAEIRNEYYGQLNSLQEKFFPVLEQLGINVDVSKVQKAWEDGAPDVKSALYQIYGEEIMRLSASKGKVANAQKQAIVKRPPTIASKLNSPPNVKPRAKFNDYGDITRSLLKMYS